MAPPDPPRSVRGIDDAVWRRFKARAAVEDRPVGEALNDAMREYLKRHVGEEVLANVGYLA